jgi:hypothetical protein
MDQVSGSPLWTGDGLGSAAPLFSACGWLQHELLPREHGEGAETLWELTGSGLQQMSVVLRPASINGDGQSVDSDGNKSLYLVFVGVVFSQHLGLLLEQLGQQHLGCFVRTAGQQHLDCF